MDVSVIIPVFNEEKFIEQCYESWISCLKMSGLSYEIIIIDNGSTDQTPALLKKFEDPFVFRVVRSSISYARNFGALKSKGNVLAFIDGDIVINKSWVDAISSFVGGGEKAFLSGYEVIVRENPSWIEKYWFANLSSNHINSANLIISRSAFDMLGGFDENLKTGEDYDLCERAKRNHSITYCPVKSFKAIHLGYPSTLVGFMKRELWHGEGDFSSFRVFLSSKVAILSFFYMLLQVTALCFLLSGFYRLSMSVLVFLFLANITITRIRFKKKPIKILMVNSFLNYLYFVARFLSLFPSLINKSRKY
jgi:glycosyltransferase involved in cell wall biosynthesis